jgi:hypothetical protein
LRFLIAFVNLQERIPVEEVFEQLKCTKEGLSSEEGAHRLEIFGPNKLEEKKVPFFMILKLTATCQKISITNEIADW